MAILFFPPFLKPICKILFAYLFHLHSGSDKFLSVCKYASAIYLTPHSICSSAFYLTPFHHILIVVNNEQDFFKNLNEIVYLLIWIPYLYRQLLFQDHYIVLLFSKKTVCTVLSVLLFLLIDVWLECWHPNETWVKISLWSIGQGDGFWHNHPTEMIPAYHSFFKCLKTNHSLT